MHRILQCLISLSLLLVVTVKGQTTAGAFNNILLCNGSFSQANGSGYASYNPEVDQGTQQYQNSTTGKTLPVDLAITLTQALNTSKLQYTTWFNPNAANYSDDFSLGYDVCGMAIGPLNENAVRRGQTDNGTCAQTLDQECIDAIKDDAQQYALELTLNPTPYPNSNLTTTSIYTVCADIQNMLNAKLPKQCSRFFNGSTQVVNATPLTGYNTSVIYASDCYTNITALDAYYPLLTQFVDYSDSTYDVLGRLVSPLLAIWMPIANAERPSTIQYSRAGLLCPRMDHWSQNSRVPAALPSPTPIGGGVGLSGGAIAGIVIGVLVGVGLIAGLAAWWFLAKRRKARKGVEDGMATGGGTVHEADEGRDGMVETKNNESTSPATTEAPDTAVHELPPDWKSHELDAGAGVTRHELPQDTEAKELVGSPVAPVELEGNTPTTKRAE